MISIPVYNLWVSDDPEDKQPDTYVIDGFMCGWKGSHIRTDLLQLMKDNCSTLFEFMAEHKLEPKMEVRLTFLKDNPVWNGWIALMFFEFESDAEGIMFNMFYHDHCDDDDD